MAGNADLGRDWREITPHIGITLFVLLAFLLALVLAYLTGQLAARAAAGPVPVAIQASGQADYSADEEPLTVPAIDPGILSSLLEDDSQAAETLPDRLARLAAALLKPVPTATHSEIFQHFLSPTADVSLTPDATWSSSLTPTPTRTPTPTGTRTAPATSVPTQAAVSTLTPTPTATPTATVTPTKTLPVNQHTLTPTGTSPACAVVDPDATVMAAASDTYIAASVGRVNANYGDNSTLVLHSIPNESYGLLRFDLSAWPAGQPVQQATLYLFGQNAPSGIDLQVYLILDDWQEMEVTWGTAPQLAEAYSAELTVPGTANCLWGINLPPELVQGWMDGSIPNHGLAIRLTGTSQEIRFSSREDSDPEQRPQLSFELQAP